LTVAFPGAGRPAVGGVSLRVAAGELVPLVGPNGAGKSSLLKAVTGLLPVRAGSAKLFGLPVGACHHRTAYPAAAGDIDWRFPLSVSRLVLTGRYVHLGWLAWPRKRDHTAAADALDRLGVGHLANRQIGELSGGQQQRVLIARALCQGADLLLLDEPFNTLDAATRADLRAVFADLRAAGKTLVVATHDYEPPAGGYDQTVALRDGRRVPG
jgi:manganese/zinc/iron transport system ATP- binding protein